MGKKNKKPNISTKMWMDVINSYSFVRMRKDNMPNPAMVFYKHAAEKIVAEKANPPKKAASRRIKAKAAFKRCGWKRRSWKRTRKILTEARKARF